MKHKTILLCSFFMMLFLSKIVYAQEIKLTFVHINDVYELQPRNGLGGVAYLGTLLKEYRKKDPQLVFTFGGDMLSPSLLSGMTKGGHMVEAMNGLGLSVGVLGNHEFDFGPETMIKQLEVSKAVWLAANLDWCSGEPLTGIQKNAIKVINGIKVGFFGLITPATAITSKSGDRVRFAPVLATARKEVATLKSQGAQLIVALTHLSLVEDRQLAAEVKGIDLILGGHDHDPVAMYEQGVMILKSGSDTQYLGMVELVVAEPQPGKPLKWWPTWQVRPVMGIAADPGMMVMVEQWQKKLDESLGTPLVTIALPFDTLEENVRTRENTFGNLVTDAMREAMGAEVALFNGGGLRGKRNYPAGYLLTAKDILTEMPFGNVTVLMALSGRDLLATLESAVGQVEHAVGRFPQVSGLKMTYDPALPSGQRVKEVRVGDSLLDLTRQYKVATTDYLSSGKDGYEALTHGKVLIDASGATLVANHVKQWLLTHKEWTPRLEGRIVRLVK